MSNTVDLKGKEGLSRILRGIFSVLAIGMMLLQVYSAGTAPLGKQVWLHAGLIFLMVLIAYPPRKGKPRTALTWMIDGVLIILTILFTIEAFATNVAASDLVFVSTQRLVLGIACILVALEASRRSLGLAMPLVVIAFLAYDFFGIYIPGALGHAPINPKVFIAENYLSDFGMFGLLGNLSNSYIFVMVAFGNLLMLWGAGDFLLSLALAVAGRFRGGPAKVAVIGSALFGTISGSALANVASVGAYTIPLMKRTGFSPEFAGAVEATASTGGMIMPPVMGAAAFVMAEFIGMPYRELIVFVTIPACLYFLGIFLQVDTEAGRRGLRGLPKSELPNVRDTLRKGWFYLVPVLVLLYCLLWQNMTPGRATFWAIIGVIFIDISRQVITSRRVSFGRFFHGLEEVTRAYLGVGSTLFVIGLIILSIDISGLAIKLTTILTSLSLGFLPFLLFFSMVANLILGMGLQATACYVFLAALAAPAIIEMGVPLFPAHMFVFYYGLASAITPPVAPASYVAAGIAKADNTKTAINACRLGIAAYFVPWLFIYHPAILLKDSGVTEIIMATIFAVVAIYCLAAGLQGYLLRQAQAWERLALIAIAFLLVPNILMVNFAACAVFILLLIRQGLLKRVISAPEVSKQNASGI